MAVRILQYSDFETGLDDPTERYTVAAAEYLVGTDHVNAAFDGDDVVSSHGSARQGSSSTHRSSEPRRKSRVGYSARRSSSSGLLRRDQFGVVRARNIDSNGMPRVACVCLGPSTGGLFGEKLVALRALPAVDEPRCHVVGKVAGVSVVVERELFDGLVANLHVVEFVVELPRPPTPTAGDSRRAVDVVHVGR